jgi:hypothetical protein
MAQGHWTEVEARAVLAAQRKSGLSVEAFARGHGLQPQRLYWWRKKLTSTAAAAVMPVRVVEREPPRGEPVTILLRSGHVLKVGRDFDEVAFVRAVELLGGIG